MGNLIKDFWTYEYKDQQYFGICEVVEGENIAQNRATKKHETHIEKALQYVMGRKVLSHMSIQKYSTWLKDREAREDKEQKYYPFTIEFESSNPREYGDVVYQALVYVTHLIAELQVHERDILIMINNSRSIYVMVNPKAFGLKPDKDLHNIYYEMYQEIKKEVGLSYVDEGIINSSYKLMKTPNCYYKGGYFVPIDFEELGELLKDTSIKAKLTSKQRSLNLNIPGFTSLAMAKLFQDAKEKVKNRNKEAQFNQDKITTCAHSCSTCKCVEFFRSGIVGQGMRNYALVSVAIQMKNSGCSKDEVVEELLQLKETWNHDESERDIRSKVNTVFRRDYNFSCEYARKMFEELEIKGLCEGCSWNKRAEESNSEILVNAEIVKELWKNNASTRHYLAYLELLQKGLLNKWFIPEEEKISDRTIRELCKFTTALNRERVKGKVYIAYRETYKGYKLPETFLERTAPILGDYLKHYLKLLIKGYKAFNKYLLIRVTKEKIMNDLGYSDVSSVYKLISKLKELGLMLTKRNNVSCVYYESYIVIDINKFKEEKYTPAAQSILFHEQYKAVNGIQIVMDQIKAYNNKPNLDRKSSRGSPG